MQELHFKTWEKCYTVREKSKDLQVRMDIVQLKNRNNINEIVVSEEKSRGVKVDRIQIVLLSKNIRISLLFRENQCVILYKILISL